MYIDSFPYTHIDSRPHINRHLRVPMRWTMLDRICLFAKGISVDRSALQILRTLSNYPPHRRHHCRYHFFFFFTCPTLFSHLIFLTDIDKFYKFDFLSLFIYLFLVCMLAFTFRFSVVFFFLSCVSIFNEFSFIAFHFLFLLSLGSSLFIYLFRFLSFLSFKFFHSFRVFIDFFIGLFFCLFPILFFFSVLFLNVSILSFS